MIVGTYDKWSMSPRGESHQQSAVGETNLTEALSNEGVEIQILKGVAMPTISETEDESKETDSSQDQETLREIDQAKRDWIALQASDTITDNQYQDATVDDPFFLKIQKQLNSSDPSRKAKAQERWLIDDDILWRREDGKKELKYVPVTLRREEIRIHHDSDFNQHAGRDSTLQDLKQRLYWPNMDADVGRYVRHCLWCRKAKS
ncbi:hypothetical protein N9O24_00930 [bacterium]|nr:hypothetical protein [bacterium]